MGVFVAETKPFFSSVHRWGVRSAYLLAVAWFAWACSQFYLPGKGFTYLIMFGDRDSAHFLPELRALDHYQIPESGGYDAQHYAQLAMHPRLGDPVLKDAIDSLPYRARRILFCWTAYVLGLGEPAWALQVYAVQNIACWLALAVLLLRWFPPDRWGHLVRWGAVLFSFGLCFSVRGSLVDGPSLLLIAGGIALAEAGRPWWSAALLGLSGLGKETNVLAGAALLRPELGSPLAPGGWRRWAEAAGRLALVVLPLAVWLVVLKVWLGEAMNTGYRNFAPPFVEYLGKWREVLAWSADPTQALAARGSALLVVALTAQLAFFALRPRWRDPWWRVGAAFSVLMVVLGEAVWEGYPGAASRVLLPMTLAFNVLVPRGVRWWPLLLLGNLTVWLAPETLARPPHRSFDVAGPVELRRSPEGRDWDVVFAKGWHGPERSRLEVWQWSRGSAELTIRNPLPHPVRVRAEFGVRTRLARTVTLRVGDLTPWRATLGAAGSEDVSLPGLTVPPGTSTWRLETSEPSSEGGPTDPRPLAFSVRNFRLVLEARER